MALMSLMYTWICALVCLDCLGLPWSALVCLGLPWSTLICLGLLGLFQITIERLKCSKAISGWDWVGLGWKSLKALILRAPLCGANNVVWTFKVNIPIYFWWPSKGPFLYAGVESV